jgi:hypothetical protein
MPTARELLEQADALMRRNRMGAAGETAGLPAAPGTPQPTTSPTSGPVVSPRTIQREPIAPTVARTSLPVDPTESPGLAASPDEQPAPPVPRPPVAHASSAAAVEFPVLTDAVDEAATASPPLDDVADDVPVLTDAVEEIDVGIVDEAARGEPSYWELTARGETSVLGPAPDSVVVVPPPEGLPPIVPQAPPQGRDPLGLDQPAPGHASPDTTGAPLAEPADRTDEPPPILSGSITEDSLADAEGEGVATKDPGVESPVAADADQPQLPVESAPAEPTLPSLSQLSELDQERIRQIAEEIGMQVLQRIDIFTDTTLRAQLGERLRPVVDRAASDLVTAINEHIGEILRAQISEAIEREIESWKNR